MGCLLWRFLPSNITMRRCVLQNNSYIFRASYNLIIVTKTVTAIPADHRKLTELIYYNALYKQVRKLDTFT